MSFKKQPRGFATNAIHAGQEPEQWTHMSVVPPLVMSTTFKQLGPDEFKQHYYGRSSNPTRNVLEACLAKLDGAKHGLTFASGVGAMTAITQILKSGDHILHGSDIYGGTDLLFSKVISKFGITFDFVDMTDVSKFEEAIKPNTRMVWMETPTNPTLQIYDIAKISELAHKHSDIIIVIDNTFQTSYLQRPLELGVDIVLYSLTKYMNGHSDVIMGAAMTNSDDLNKRLRFIQYATGIVPSPFDCYQVNRSLKTLALRMKQHSKSSLIIAKHLEANPLVEKVLHPGLPSHPQHNIAVRQSYGHSGMISFYIKGGLEESKKFLMSLRRFTMAASLGSDLSLAQIPVLISHSEVPEERRAALGITGNMIRLSVGLEDVEDLIDDLDAAIKASQL